MRLSKLKCQVLPLGRNNLRHQYMLGASGKQLCRKEPGDPGGHQAEHEPATGLSASHLDCIQRSIAGGSRKVVLSLCSALVRHIWSAGSSAGLASMRQM